jgi:hypothetical protein
MLDGLLLERVGAPLLPLAGIGVVTAFEGLGEVVFGVFYIGTAVGADVAELAVLADFYLVFVDVPVFLEAGLFEGLLQGGVTDIAITLLHAGAVLDIAFGVYGDFAVEAGVVVLGFSEKRYSNGKIMVRNYPTS